MTPLIADKLPTILIYIPCYIDQELAFANVRKIDQQVSRLHSTERKFILKIVVSINGVEPIYAENLPENVEVIKYRSNIGGDTNISLGFMKASELEPDYFWLLSANEILQDNTIVNLFQLLSRHKSADIFVANAAGRENKLDINNVFMGLPPKLGLGLISSVIYKFDKTNIFFAAAIRYGWTGWGQLAVVQEFLNNTADPKVVEFPYENLFKKPFTFLGSSSLDERSFVRINYRHSFYGLPTLASSMLQGNRSELKRYLWRWLLDNWFKVNFYKMSREELNLKSNKDLAWSSVLFKEVFKRNSKILWACVLFFEKLPFIKLEKIRLLQNLLSKFKTYM